MLVPTLIGPVVTIWPLLVPKLNTVPRVMLMAAAPLVAVLHPGAETLITALVSVLAAAIIASGASCDWGTATCGAERGAGA